MASTAPPDALAQAADPTTAPDELRSLAGLPDPDCELRRLVARNPNASMELLLQLALVVPGDVLQNPVLSLYLMESPQAFFRSPMVVQNLLGSGPLPAWFVDALQAHWSPDEDSFVMRRIGEWLARAPETSPEVVEKLCTCMNPEARAAASCRPEAPAGRLELLRKAGSDRSMREAGKRRGPIEEGELREVARMGYWGAWLAASHPQAPLDLLEEFAEDRRPTVVAAVASNGRAPAGLLERLAGHPSYVVRRQMTQNRGTRREALERLARSNEPDVVRLVLLHEQAPPELLASFAGNRSFHGTLAAARRTPPGLLEGFVKDPSLYVRRQAARNPSTPPGALEQLAQDPRYEVRLSALLNPSLPWEWVERLTTDRSKEVRARAERRLARRRPKTPA